MIIMIIIIIISSRMLGAHTQGHHVVNVVMNAWNRTRQRQESFLYICFIIAAVAIELGHINGRMKTTLSTTRIPQLLSQRRRRRRFQTKGTGQIHGRMRTTGTSQSTTILIVVLFLLVVVDCDCHGDDDVEDCVRVVGSFFCRRRRHASTFFRRGDSGIRNPQKYTHSLGTET
jgi:hypothetical protein